MNPGDPSSSAGFRVLVGRPEKYLDQARGEQGAAGERDRDHGDRI